MTENILGTSLKSLIDQAKYNSISIVKEDPNNQIACEYSCGQSQSGKDPTTNTNIHFRTKGECDVFTKALMGKIKELGFKYELVPNGEGVPIVRVDMPKGFEGQDPARMDPSTLKDAQKAAEEEKKLDLLAKYGNKEDGLRAKGEKVGLELS